MTIKLQQYEAKTYLNRLYTILNSDGINIHSDNFIVITGNRGWCAFDITMNEIVVAKIREECNDCDDYDSLTTTLRLTDVGKLISDEVYEKIGNFIKSGENQIVAHNQELAKKALGK